MTNHPIFVVSFLGAAVFASGVVAEQVSEPLRDRREFARAIGKLDKGAPKSQVVALLGPPEDVRTQNDPRGIATVGTKEIWRYGTSGHLTVATLGQVYMDQMDRVQYIFGKGEPPPADLFTEQQLRRLLDALGQVPSYNSVERYNPRKVIAAVNLLQPLGKDKALAAIDEYLRVASHWHDDGREGAFLVLRTLFDVPDDPGFMPRMLVGAPIPSAPDDPKLLPRFPLTIEGDIPLLLVSGFNLGGEPERPESHVKYFREHGRVRAGLLIPTNEPFRAFEEFARSPRWHYAQERIGDDDWRGRQLLSTQLLRLIDTVYRVEPGQSGSLLPWNKLQAGKIIAAAAGLKIVWNAAANQYTFPDGKTLPGQLGPKDYRREVWKPEVEGLEIEVVIERDGPRDVSVSFTEDYEIGKTSPMAIIRVLAAEAEERALLTFRTGEKRPDLSVDVPPGTKGVRALTKSLKLEEGKQIRVELKTASESLTSPVMKP